MKKILLITCLLLLCSCTINNNKIVKCPELIEDSFNINFHTDGGSEIKSILYKVSSDINIEDPVKEGYRFAGWFYEESFLNKFSGIIIPNYTRDSNGCENGFRDIDLYALWIKK